MLQLTKIKAGVIDCFGFDEAEIMEVADKEILEELTIEQRAYLKDYLS